MIRYSNRYFNTVETDPIELWCKLGKMGSTKSQWNGILLIIELCLCAPYSNATLERYFSHMNIIKSDIRNRLSSKSLNSVLAIRMSGFSVREFNSIHVNKCVDYWYNKKDQRLHKKRRKTYKKRESKIRKRQPFDFNNISSSSSETALDQSEMSCSESEE